MDLDQIRRTAERVAASQGLEIVDIECLGGNKHRTLRVFIEKNRQERARKSEEARLPSGKELADTANAAFDGLAWVTHEDCEHFSRDFGTVLDVEELVPGGEYTLEVSSPGLDRKLTTREDFERFQGSMLKVRTFVPLAGNRHWQGRLTEVKEKGIVLDLTATGRRSGKKSAQAVRVVEIAFSDIEKANLVPEF